MQRIRGANPEGIRWNGRSAGGIITSEWKERRRKELIQPLHEYLRIQTLCMREHTICYTIAEWKEEGEGNEKGGRGLRV